MILIFNDFLLIVKIVGLMSPYNICNHLICFLNLINFITNGNNSVKVKQTFVISSGVRRKLWNRSSYGLIEIYNQLQKTFQ
jgi:hypothetical protein